ncbi:MAG: histidine phosphatase family protein [Porphyromonas sp.]|nr:histidine phosphatase family protein [Porphyromonas sp.]
MLIIDWIRHTSLKVSGEICYGQTDMEVADTFDTEAEAVKAIVASRAYDAVYTSPLTRAAKLCEACGLGDRAIRDPRIMERNFGAWELKTWAEIEELTKSDTPGGKYLDHLGQIAPPMGESVCDLIERVTDFIEDVRTQRLRRVAVFCHGGVINSARHLQGLIALDRLFMEVPAYGSITELTYAYSDGRCIKIG